MEATAYEIEFDFIVDIVALPNGFRVHNTDIVVLHGDCQHLFIAVESHTKDGLALGRWRLPSGNEVIVILTRGRLVFLLSDPHGHLTFV